MAAPGWLKITPLIATLSLVFPQVRQVVGVSVLNDYEPLLHGIRLYLVYGATGLFLLGPMKIALPPRSWRDVQWFVGISLFAALIATLAGEGMHIAAGNMTLGEAAELLQPWWLGDSLGILMVTPIMVPVLSAMFSERMTDWNWPSAADWLAQAGMIGAALFLGIWGAGAGLVLWYLIIPIIIMSALLGGYEKAATAIVLSGFLTPLLSAWLDDAIAVSDLAVPLLTAFVAALLVGAATSERQKSAAVLQELVAQRTQELEKAYELQRHLVRSLGHDLRQPIEALNLTLDGLSAQVTTLPKQKAVERARDLGALTSSLLSRILVYARLDMGNVEPIEQRFPVRSLFERLETTYGPLAKSKDIDLVWQFADIDLMSDPEMLFQVLSNHLDNAIRLGDSGNQITVLTDQASAGTGIFVIDDFSHDMPKQDGAAGLGLKIVSQIADLMDAKNIIEPNRRGVILRNTL